MKDRITIKERVKITGRGIGILRKYCPGLAGGKAVSALIAAIQPLLSVWLSAKIINELAGARRTTYLLTYVAAVVLCNFLLLLMKSMVDRVTEEKEAQMWNFFGKVFADKSMTMDYADLEDVRVLQKKQEASENLFMFGNGLGQLVWGINSLVNATASIVLSLSLTVTLFFTDTGNGWMDSPLWIVGIGGCVIVGGIANANATRKENSVFETWCKETVWFNRAFMFFGHELAKSPERAKDVRIYSQHKAATRAFAEMRKRDEAVGGYLRVMATYPALAAVVVGIGTVVCWVFVVLKASLGAFGVGSIVQYIGALGKLSTGVQDMMFVVADNEVYCRHLKGLYEYLDIPNRKEEGTRTLAPDVFGDGNDGHEADYEIEFCNVSFRYPGAEEYSLRNLSLKFKIGERLAIVGKNGSGKTTFIKLLCRLYDPTEGEIRLNGVDIREYAYEEYLRIFSVVFQDFKLFSFSLGQNVATDMEYDREKAEKCLIKAGFTERLKAMPNGLDTAMYKDFESEGVEISGGEAQKVALARALYKDAPIVVLDEPTAALDPIAEAEVYTKFNELIGEKTAIYISHRLSSCKFCDEIAVFDEGTVVQRGAHEELLREEDGLYHKLWTAQAQYYEAG
ncbi:MAG: ABC transporter ATP-binding protein [Lachnospiraceae bacterium]|nr:ABC transporter ATP-binding protein [Lachnospiraceae bacterium]